MMFPWIELNEAQKIAIVILTVVFLASAGAMLCIIAGDISS